MQIHACDVAIVGTGVAGLVAALRASATGASVHVLGDGGGASNWLQGVNAAFGDADPHDNPVAHRDDILRESYGISTPDLAEDTARHVLAVIREIDALGVGFARDGERFRQRHASGSTYPRCCYVAGTMWGPRARKVLTKALEERTNVAFSRTRVVRVLTNGGRAVGVAGFTAKGGEPVAVAAGAVVLASGGAGAIFAHSTYPRDVVGASYAMAFHAGARLIDMEFIQFEPLVAYAPQRIRGYVVPTTLFGDGATLRDAAGARFLLEERPGGEAGIGKEALVLEMANMARLGRAGAGGEVWLDARSVPPALLEGYPWLYPYLKRRGVDIGRDLLAVLPAAHTSLGGIAVDRDRRTSVPGLLAAGEAAGGLHGAGRLAGGSGTDVLAGGSRAGAAAAARSAGPDVVAARAAFLEVLRDEAAPGRPNRAQASLFNGLRGRMSHACGIWRDEAGLRKAINWAEGTYRRTAPRGPVAPADPSLRLADALLVGGMILEGALRRRESRGAHQRTDYPTMNPALGGSTALPWVAPFGEMERPARPA